VFGSDSVYGLWSFLLIVHLEIRWSKFDGTHLLLFLPLLLLLMLLLLRLLALLLSFRPDITTDRQHMCSC